MLRDCRHCLPRLPGSCSPTSSAACTHLRHPGYSVRVRRPETLSIREAREQLPRILDGFRKGDREPVFVGAQRRTDGVVLPIDIYHELLERRVEAAQQAEASVQVEGPAPSPAARKIVDRWARGELTSSAMREGIRRLHGGA